MDEDKKPRFIHMPNTNVMDRSAIDAAYYKKQVLDSRVIYSKVMAINSSQKSKLVQIAPKSLSYSVCFILETPFQPYQKVLE